MVCILGSRRGNSRNPGPRRARIMIDELEGCMTEDEAAEIQRMAEGVALRAEQLAAAWQQYQQKATWPENVRWCHDELAVELAHLEEALDR